MDRDITGNVLVGNTFPLTLIRRKVEIEPMTLEDLKAKLDGAKIFSFWGHENTVAAASMILGYDLKPKYSRPALTLDSSGHPKLYGTSFTECWLLNPNYKSPDYRPSVGEEVELASIAGWQVLMIRWI